VVTTRGQIAVEAESPPSSYAIADLVSGKPGAFGRTAGLTALRGAFILPGLYAAGVRDRQLLTGALYGSVGITLWLMGLYAMKRH
jgi:hypothetical protein